MPDLVRLGMCASWLDVDDFFHAHGSKYVVIAADPLLESQVDQELTKVGKTDGGIGHATQDALSELVVPAHLRLSGAL
ncbi:hypothetical protein [Immundisolibacter sp.]|uniref:hypothetical protein n=1 Tax=Immundisolibacter sp. TaxID=1934948 RepID=UPI00261B15E0|nr:hypothetical protein [Immundisolibacter sp.]MDD3652134.1 hypothetical protein [Immundisolibacter sp.]